MPLFEFRMLCTNDESCKRVRFYMETGLTPLPVMNEIKNYVSPKKQKCSHEIPFEIQDIMNKEPTFSQEIICEKCKCLLTLIPFEHNELKTGCFAVVDFPNYDQNNGNFHSRWREERSLKEPSFFHKLILKQNWWIK